MLYYKKCGLWQRSLESKSSDHFTHAINVHNIFRKHVRATKVRMKEIIILRLPCYPKLNLIFDITRLYHYVAILSDILQFFEDV